MNQKIGRNDPCPCGSGKKYKNCCMLKDKPAGKKKFTAKWLGGPKPVDLFERTFGDAIKAASHDEVIHKKEDEPSSLPSDQPPSS